MPTPSTNHGVGRSCPIPTPRNAGAAWFKARGEFTYGNLDGFFIGLHYFFLDHPEMLMGFLGAPDCMRNLVRRLGEWNLAAARHMLEASGVPDTVSHDIWRQFMAMIAPLRRNA